MYYIYIYRIYMFSKDSLLLILFQSLINTEIVQLKSQTNLVF